MIQLKIFKCRFVFTFSFFALVALCNIFVGIKDGGYLIFCVLLHECAHVAAMVICGKYPSTIRASALGLRIILHQDERNMSYMQTAAVSLSGPVSSLVFALCALFFWGESHPLFMINLALGVLHILPIMPLDGGMALKSVLCAALGLRRGAKVSTVISFLTLLPVAVLGFLLLLKNPYNFSLLALSMYLLFYLSMQMGSADF